MTDDEKAEKAAMKNREKQRRYKDKMRMQGKHRIEVWWPNGARTPTAAELQEFIAWQDDKARKQKSSSADEQNDAQLSLVYR
jgi:hypothetical protein